MIPRFIHLSIGQEDSSVGLVRFPHDLSGWKNHILNPVNNYKDPRISLIFY